MSILDFGLWASSGPFPLLAHYGLYKRGRDPPTNHSHHLKKKGVFLSQVAAQGGSRKETNRRRHCRRTTTCRLCARRRDRRLPLPWSLVINVLPSCRRRRRRRLRPPPPPPERSTVIPSDHPLHGPPIPLIPTSASLRQLLPFSRITIPLSPDASLPLFLPAERLTRACQNSDRAPSSPLLPARPAHRRPFPTTPAIYPVNPLPRFSRFVPFPNSIPIPIPFRSSSPTPVSTVSP